MPTDKDDQNLDFLRCVAVLCVYVFHLQMALGRAPAVDIGHLGVLFFFVHTSLVLMMSLERLQARGESLFAGFYVRRAFRIYPLSLAVVGAVLIWHLPRAPWWPYQALGPGDVAANLLLVMNLVYAPPVTSVLWSLPLEVQMYVLLPAIYLIGRRFGVRGIAALWLLSVVAGLTLPRVSERLDVFGFGPCFMAGALSYFIGAGRRKPEGPRWLWPLTLLAAGCLFWAYVAAGEKRLGSWAMCLLVGVALPFCAAFPWWHGLTHRVARYSYGIYLTHLYAMWLSFVVLAPQPAALRWFALVSVSLALPIALYHGIEAPMIRLGAALASRLGASSAAAKVRPQAR